MKLYATVKSDRATKGQGSNKDLLIVLTAEINGERVEVAFMSMIVTDKGYYNFEYRLPDGQTDMQKVSSTSYHYGDTPKGEQQKGECKHRTLRAVGGASHCLDCGDAFPVPQPKGEKTKR